MNENYPIEEKYDSKAPWNQRDNESQEIEVTVSITLSKTVKIKVDDYTTKEEVDNDGGHHIHYDFSKCDLESAVLDQVTLPNEVGEFSDWIEDDLEIILE